MRGWDKMKKILITLLVVLTLTIIIAPAASAADLNMVTDITGTLTDRQMEMLTEQADRITELYRCDVAIVIIDEMDYNDDAYYVARQIYEQYNFGYGTDRSGVLFFLSITDRAYAMVAYGFGNTAFTDHGKDVMLDDYILPQLRDNNYFMALSVYLNKAEEFLQMARNGTPFDRGTDPAAQGEADRQAFMIKLAVTIILPLLIAALICMIWRSQMKTAVAATTAFNYIPPGGFNLTNQTDMFLYRTTTRVRVKTESKGGTSIDSRGFSGRSGRF